MNTAFVMAVAVGLSQVVEAEPRIAPPSALAPSVTAIPADLSDVGVRLRTFRSDFQAGIGYVEAGVALPIIGTVIGTVIAAGGSGDLEKLRTSLYVEAGSGVAGVILLFVGLEKLKSSTDRLSPGAADVSGPPAGNALSAPML